MSEIRYQKFFPVVTVILLMSSLASASGCLSRPTIDEGIKNSKVIFAGKVVARLKYGVRFKVEKSWKGLSKRYIYVYTGNARNDLDPWFEKGERWLVYAIDQRIYQNMNATGPYVIRLRSPACNRTVPLESAMADLRQLGEPTPIAAKSPRK